MGSTSLTGKVLRFGPFELDPEKQQLRRAGVLVRIQPQPLKVLVTLACRGGQLVTREELRRELWGQETFVDFEQGLNYCIRQIRAVLGDEAQTPSYIETIPRRGYCFIATVDGLAETPRRDSNREINPVKKIFHLRALPVATLLLVLIGATTYEVWFRPSQRRFTDRDTIILAEFTNRTGDSAFDDVLRQALTIYLEQSPFLQILSDDRVARTLKLMQRSGERLTPELAQEVCLRNNSNAMLAGSIASVGNHYLLVLKASDCQTGDTLASAAAEAENREKVLDALEKAGNQIRHKLGESLTSVNRFNKPLREATTSSLEALKAFTQGAQVTDRPESIVDLKRAVELDPNFARAYIALGTAYANSNQLTLASQSIQRGYDLRKRESERERMYIEVVYNTIVTGDLEKANQGYLEMISEYPDAPIGNLGFNYALMGYYERAAALTLQALRLDPDFPIWNGNLEADYVLLGRLDEAKTVFDQALARKVDGIDLRLARYYLAFLQNDTAKMQEEVAWATGQPNLEDWLFSAESDTAAYYGRFRQAGELSRRAAESARRSGTPETAASWLANAALRNAEFGDANGARTIAAQALNLSLGPGVKILTALALARSGDARRAQKLADELSRQFPMNTMLQAYWLPTIRASLELDNGHSARAIELLDAASQYELAQTWQFQLGTMYPVYVRGVAHLKAGYGDQAGADFQEILDHRTVILNFPLASVAYLQLGRSKAAVHDTDGARQGYKDFLTLWKDADPDVPILKQARAEYEKLR
jgi:eukaryotic-like serine/threonine-protein kinase